MIAFYSDNYHNFAYIERTKSAPYYGAKKINSYRLVCRDSDEFVYFVSVYEKRTDAEKVLKTFSGGTFKRI